MKNFIKNLIALVVTAIIVTTSTASTFAADGKKETVLTTVKKVNKIKVSGNVELILVNSTDERVKVYDDYYAKNALVQQKDGELRISSFNEKTLTVVVYVNNLTELTASDNATVKTYGKFSAMALNVNLEDKAIAYLDMNTISLSTSVSGEANLTLTGSTEDYSSLMGGFAKVNTVQFTAQTTTIQSKNTAVAKVIVPAQLPDAG